MIEHDWQKISSDICKHSANIILVESRSWRDGNFKFGPNCDLEVNNLEKNKKFGEAKPSQIFYFFPNYPPPDHNLWAKF